MLDMLLLAFTPHDSHRQSVLNVSFETGDHQPARLTEFACFACATGSNCPVMRGPMQTRTWKAKERRTTIHHKPTVCHLLISTSPDMKVGQHTMCTGFASSTWPIPPPTPECEFIQKLSAFNAAVG
jgi:hypothetical protein